MKKLIEITDNRDNIRKNNFWHSNPSLTSRRVHNILSNPKNSRKLAVAIHSLRTTKGKHKVTFILSTD